jgi:hypothetical protein
MTRKMGQWMFDLPGCPQDATCAVVESSGNGYWVIGEPRLLSPGQCGWILDKPGCFVWIPNIVFDATGWYNSKLIREKKMDKMPEFETGDIAVTDSGRYWLKCGAVWYELGSYSDGSTEIVSSAIWPPDCDGSKFVALYRGDCFAYDEIGEVMDGKIKPIWKRDVKEMTVDQISEALGYKVKVVGNDQH